MRQAGHVPELIPRHRPVPRADLPCLDTVAFWRTHRQTAWAYYLSWRKRHQVLEAAVMACLRSAAPEEVEKHYPVMDLCRAVIVSLALGDPGPYQPNWTEQSTRIRVGR